MHNTLINNGYWSICKLVKTVHLYFMVHISHKIRLFDSQIRFGLMNVASDIVQIDVM